VKDKSLEMLEFPRVKEILAGYASFALSKEMVQDLKPSTDVDQVSHWLKESAEARRLLSVEPDISIGGVSDIREPVVLASRGKVLELPTLVDVQHTLTSIRYLHNKLSRLKDESPLLSQINSQITPLPQIEK
jgi:DNA mismatch repair protein MutS2